MRHQIRVIPDYSWWWRIHSNFKDYIHIQDKKESVEYATKIAKRHKLELKIWNSKIPNRYWNLYSGNPFHKEENNTIYCWRKHFPQKKYI